MALKSDANLKENWLVTWKMTLGIWLIFMRAVESLKNCTLIGSFHPKHIKIYMKKNRRVMSYDTEKWCKVWRKTESWFQEMTWGIWWILMRAVESLKIYPFLDCFCRMCVIYELKNTENQKKQGVEKTTICFIRIQSENIKMTWNIGLFIFCIICNFSKCGDFKVF